VADVIIPEWEWLVALPENFITADWKSVTRRPKDTGLTLRSLDDLRAFSSQTSKTLNVNQLTLLHSDGNQVASAQ
jgi:hypothetical protein